MEDEELIAEYEVYLDDEMVAGASGQKDRAYREAMNYAMQYVADGNLVEVMEVSRKLVFTLKNTGAGGWLLESV